MRQEVTPVVVASWHKLAQHPRLDRLLEMLAPGVVFRSPAVHSPQCGQQRASAYLWAALQVLGPTLTYQREWYGSSSAVLQFTATVGERDVEGVDIIDWDVDGLISTFTVMVRPYKALQVLIDAMRAELDALECHRLHQYRDR